MISKLGPNYLVFVSTFYSTKSSLGATWKIPSLDSFVADLFLFRASRSDENKGRGSNQNIGREGYVSGSDPETVKKGGEGIGDAGVDVCVFL